MINSKLTKIFLMEAHSWDVAKSYFIRSEQGPFEVVIAESLRECDSKFSFVFIADDLCESRVVDYFPRNRRVGLLKESPVHTRKLDINRLKSRFDLVLTHREDLIKLGAPFFRLDFSSNWIFRDIGRRDYSNKSRSVSFIGSIQHDNSNGYAFRKLVAEKLIEFGNVDCFGRGIASLEFKADALEKYRFSIVMENCRENFYYSEKILDCFLAEVIPIYWGCPAIGDVFDARGIISFDTLSDLVLILDGLSEEKYLAMIEYALENKRRCYELRLDSYESYLFRGIEAVTKSDFILGVQGTVSKRSKYSAASRRFLRKLIGS